MKNPKITRKITQGMYVLTTRGGGCVVDAVARVGGAEQPLIAVSVAKTNHSHKLMSENERFALSVIGEKTNPQVIATFGFKSSKDVDKCAECGTTEVEGVPVVEDSLGYMVCEKVDAVDTETHTLFIGRMIEADVFADGAPMTYAYYQEHKTEMIQAEAGSAGSAGSGAKRAEAGTSAKAGASAGTEGEAGGSAETGDDDLKKATSEQGKTAWVCTVCGYVYYGDEVPDDYKCPLCGLGKEYFKKQEA